MRRRGPRTDLKVGHYIRRKRTGHDHDRSRDRCIVPLRAEKSRRGKQGERGKDVERAD